MTDIKEKPDLFNPEHVDEGRQNPEEILLARIQKKRASERARVIKKTNTQQKLLKLKPKEKENTAKNEYILKTEIIKPKHSLWGIAENLRKELMRRKYPEISQGETSTDRTEDRIFLTEAIERLNREFNPKFENVDENLSNIPANLAILIPTTKYLDIVKKDLEKEGEDEEKEIAVKEKIENLANLKKNLPIYKNPALVNAGNIYLTNKFGLNLERIVTHPSASNSRNTANRKETKYIILHSTETSTPDRGLESTAANGKAHYVIGRDGKIFRVRDEKDNFDHAGRFRNSKAKAIWNGETDISSKSVGIEVATKPGEPWNEKQYAAVRNLIHALGARSKIQAKNILTHSQVACSRFGRGRKQDPWNVQWAKLGLPNNYLLVDRDVVSGKILPNFAAIEKDWEKRPADRKKITEGLQYSVELRNRFKGDFENARSKSRAELKKELLAGGYSNYEVKPGDNLWEIARKQKTSAFALRIINDLTSTAIKPTQQLKIPKSPN